MFFSTFSIALLSVAGTVVSADLDPIEVKGTKFFYKNGTQFFMKGIAYQQESAAAGGVVNTTKDFIDPLADEESCKRDVPLLKELGTNTIRTYAINPDANHTLCMQLLQDAGIYVISDLGQPKLSINRDNPQWNVELFDRYKKVVDELAKYSNVIGFFAGNEVSNNKSNTDASAYVKAAVRDTKAYLRSKQGQRWLGVGYAANDDADIRADIAQYFNCDKQEDSIDFWGYNIYSWCGRSDMEKSGYNDQIKFFENYSVPVFFAEYGCNEPGGAANRIYQETGALYFDNMTQVFSGGIVYMYFQEANDYGLVEVKNNKATKLKDFDALKNEVAKANPKGVSRDSYNPSNRIGQCPNLSDNWKANKALPPTPDQSLCDCMVKSRSCVQQSGLDSKKYGDIFGYICGRYSDICSGIRGNASTGVYGAYSMCSDSAKLDYVLDAYYRQLRSDSSACDFNNQARLQTPNSDSTCSSKVSKASDINNRVATATSAADAAGASSSDNFAAPGAPMTRLVSSSGFAVSLYLLMALAAGAGVVAL